MAKYDINFTPNPEKGISYTVITDDSNDWNDVPSNTYFYDKDTNLPYYKNSDDDILSVFSTGGSVSTIYSANDTLSGDRTIYLDKKVLTFDVGTTTTIESVGIVLDSRNTHSTGGNSSIVFSVLGSSGNSVFELNSGGYFISTSDYTSAIATMENRSGEQGLNITDHETQLACQTFRLNPDKASTSTGVIMETTADMQQLSIQKAGATSHWLRAGDSAAQASFFVNGFSGRGFNVGAGNQIGTEDISLQGDTLISEKLELSSITNGILLNRVTTTEMNDITTATLNEIVFNTELNSLYQYDGTNWVSLAAGYGLVGSTDATGRPTFYTTVKDAYDSGNGSIKLYTDITETSSNTISITSGTDIDLNGYTYIYDVSDDSHVFDSSTLQHMTLRIINGRIVRKNGGDTSSIFNFTGTQTQIDVINVYVKNENGCVLKLSSTFNGFGSTFICNNTSGNGVEFGSGSKVEGGKYIQKNNGSNYTIGSELKNVEWVCEGTGKNTVGGGVFNSRFISNSGVSLYTSVSFTKIYDCYAYSASNNALDIRNNSEIYNSTLISNSPICVNSIGGSNTKIIGCYVSGSNSSYSINSLSIIQDCIIMNSGTGGGISVSSLTKIINNTITLESGTNNGINIITTVTGSIISNNKIFVNDNSAVGISSSSTSAYIVDNIVKGTSTAFDLGSGSNLWNVTKDSQGNSAQL